MKALQVLARKLPYSLVEYIQSFQPHLIRLTLDNLKLPIRVPVRGFRLPTARSKASSCFHLRLLYSVVKE